MKANTLAAIILVGVAIFGAADAAPGSAVTPPALGRHDLKPATIEAAQGREIKDTDLFDPETQDALAKNLLDRAGFQDVRNGGLSGADFQERVARTWSSVEDPTAPGQSHFMKRNVDTHTRITAAKASPPPYNRELSGSYQMWRDRLTASGWRPYRMKPSAECRLFYGMCERFPETVDCAPTGKSYCNLAFLDAKGHFIIVGVDAELDFGSSGSVVVAPAAASHLNVIRARVAFAESDARLRAGGMRIVSGGYPAARAKLIAEGLRPYAFEHSGKSWDDCAKVYLEQCRAHTETLTCARGPIEDALELCISVFNDNAGRSFVAYQSSPPYGGVRVYPADAGDLQMIKAHMASAKIPSTLADPKPAR